MRTSGLVVVIVVLAACTSPARAPASRASLPREPFKASEMRQPAVFVRFQFGPGTFSARERALLPAEYEGALVEALNARAVVARDVRLVAAGERFDVGAAARRAREVGADHAIVVDVTLARGETVFCRETRRAFRAAATVWSQRAEVVRASDGVARLAMEPPGVEVSDLQADCDDPRKSERRPAADTMSGAIDRFLERLLGS